MNRSARSIMVWVIMASLLVYASYQVIRTDKTKTYDMPFYELQGYLEEAKAGMPRIIDLEIENDVINGQFAQPELKTLTERGVTREERFTHFKITLRMGSEYPLEEKLYEAGIAYKVKTQSRFPQWAGLFATTLLPILLLVGIMIFISRQMQGTGNRAMAFGKSRAKLHSDSQPKKTFEDVAGVEEPKEALQEVIDFLKDPKKYQRLGGRIPKGVLLMGAPGTGKTLLARAVAGEANVPFFSISGSDFVEMFVGVGASRVRDLFETGRKNAPCIIFIDELDAVGRHRGAGIGGGHDEREQTLNQLLVEMDGFDTSEGVILIAATNRPDVLDPALLRPGRFDRRIVVDLPDIKGREEIFDVHLRKVRFAPDVDTNTLAKGTPYFSGADIESTVNEAALLAARQDKEFVDMAAVEEAKDIVMMGPERRSMVISDREKTVTAHHEAGHALVQHMLPDADPNYKCSIIPRGRALGVTVKLPLEERHNYGKNYLVAEITTRLAGRVAEEMIFNEQTTGAKNDFEVATDMARKMVCEWGMSSLGPMTLGKRDEQMFLGKELVQHKDYSEDTAIRIDQEIEHLITDAYNHATQLITDNLDSLKRLAEALLEKEVLDAKEIEETLGPRPQPAQAPTA